MREDFYKLPALIIMLMGWNLFGGYLQFGGFTHKADAWPREHDIFINVNDNKNIMNPGSQDFLEVV